MGGAARKHICNPGRNRLKQRGEKMSIKRTEGLSKWRGPGVCGEGKMLLRMARLSSAVLLPFAALSSASAQVGADGIVSGA
jgi:hypothetical protein